MEIIPSILVTSEQRFIEQVTAVQSVLNMIQLDIADGEFVPNKTWADPKVVEEHAKIDVELHLMVSDPMREMERWSATEQIKRVFVHFEAVKNLKEVLATIHEYGWDAGVVLNPETSHEVIDEYLSDIQAVMFMGVNPGFQKQKLIPEVLEKITDFKSLYPAHYVSIDGGVNEETLPDIFAAGADAICPGSAIFGNERMPEENIQRMREIIDKRAKN